MTSSVQVWIDRGAPVYVGTAYFTVRRRNLTTAFRYDDAYLARPDAVPVDPHLPLVRGAHRVDGLPGTFRDSSPDRWGRNLIARQFRARAVAYEGALPSLGEVDYLVGVSDATRQGDLRFRMSTDGPFLDPGDHVPPLVELPSLLHAADQVARDGDDMEAVKVLLAAGTGSLGGARPKASVRDGDRLLIAKFPHHSDEWDMMAWEATALDLAERAGLPVPPRRLVSMSGRSVLLVERFDRAAGRRVGYASAMTLVGAVDGEVRDYLDVVDVLADVGARARADRQELWRRIAFSVAIHNTDDHLRNLGFLRDGTGWSLAPVFDVNPDPDAGSSRVTGIGGIVEPQGEIDALFETAPYFDLDANVATTVWEEVRAAVGTWRAVAAAHGMTQGVEAFAPAFAQIEARTSV